MSASLGGYVCTYTLYVEYVYTYTYTYVYISKEANQDICVHIHYM